MFEAPLGGSANRRKTLAALAATGRRAYNGGGYPRSSMADVAGLCLQGREAEGMRGRRPAHDPPPEEPRATGGTGRDALDGPSASTRSTVHAA